LKSPKTVYLITRAHGLKSHLLRAEDFDAMLRTATTRELVNFISKGDYASELSKYPTEEVDAYLLEKIFYQKLSKRFSSLIQIASGRTGKAMEQYCKRLEVENIKRIIRAKHQKNSIDENQLIPISRRYQSVNFAALLGAQTIREMVELLRETPYAVLRTKFDLYAKYNNPWLLEALAEKVYYRNLWKSLENVPEEIDVKKLVGTEIDLKNLLLVFSLKHIKLGREFLDDIIDDTHYELPKSVIKSMIEVTPDMIPRLITWPPYVELAQRAAELYQRGSLIEIENTFARYTFTNAEKITLRRPNSLAFVFAYLALCLREAQNLATLVIGKKESLSEERIRHLLVI